MRLKFFCLIFTLLLVNITFSTGINYMVNEDEDILINSYYQLPFKDQSLDHGLKNWKDNISSREPKHGDFINPYLGNINGEDTYYDISFKCLSYASSTINDWYNIQKGLIMEEYQSYLTGRFENGTNPRALENIYHEKGKLNKLSPLRYEVKPSYSFMPFGIGLLIGDLKHYCKTEFEHDSALDFTCNTLNSIKSVDPITQELIPINLEGYSKILSSIKNSVVNIDYNIPSFSYTVDSDYYNIDDYEAYKRPLIYDKKKEELKLKYLLDAGNPILAFTENFDSNVKIHVMAIIGYKELNEQLYFLLHDNYGFSDLPYKALTIDEIPEAYYFISGVEWPTFHADNRRTGLSLLKGDMSENRIYDESKYKGSPDTDFLNSPAIADIIENKEGSEIIVGTTGLNKDNGNTVFDKGRVFSLDKDGNQEWSTTLTLNTDDLSVPATPTISDLDYDGNKEVIFGTTDGRVYVLDAKTGQEAIDTLEGEEADYIQVPRSTYNFRGYVYSVESVDVDLDGNKEIVFADFNLGMDWQAHLYVYDYDNGNLKQKSYSPIPIGTSSNSGGAKDHMAFANLDNDTQPEIVINTFTGVYIYDGLTGRLQDSKELALTTGSPVIVDIDRDNIYEIIVNTYDLGCYDGFTCNDATNIIQLDEKGKISSIDPVPHTEGWSPYRTPAVAHLDDDGVMEIVTYSNKGSKGMINIIDGKTLEVEKSYSTNLDFLEGSPSIADIDNTKNGKEILIVSTHGIDIDQNSYDADSSRFIVLSNELEYLWDIPISAGMYGSPAIGDLDGQKDAEVMLTHAPVMTSGSSMRTLSYEGNTVPLIGTNFLKPMKLNNESEFKVSGSFTASSLESGAEIKVYGGINKQPILTVPEEIIVIAGDLIDINASAYDPNNDSFEIYYSAPFNNSGFWQTNESHYGDYEILVTASDGNLSSSEYVRVKVLRHDAIKITNTNVELVNNSRIMLSRVYIEGINSQSNETEYQNNATITEANIVDSSIANLTDGNWDTYYSAGSLTGAIVEQNNLNIPENTKHIIVHLKLKITEEGNGRFALYDYNNDYYDIVTSNLPVGENDYYFEIYDDDESYFTQDDTHYTLKVDNISNYINESNIRWYYRYLNGDFYDQRVYGSEVKFVTGISKPSNVTLNLNGKDISYEGTLDNNTFTLDKFSDGKTSDSLTINGNKVTKHIKVPRGVDITNAIIRIGNKSVTSINATKIMTVSEGQSKVSKLNIPSPKEYIPDFIVKSPNGNIETLKVNMSEDITVQDYCRDWSVNPSGDWNSYIDYIKFGPHCADQRDWHKTDIDDDGYPEYYMTTGETYSVWGKCRAEGTFNRKVDDFETSSGSSYGCVDGNCNEETEETKINLVQNSKKEKLSYPSMFCNVDGWTWGWNSGTSFKYWDSNSNGEWDSGEHKEYYMVLECGQDSDCADNKFCNKAGLSDPLDFSCETPSCSQVTCQSWEITNISNHECGCDLAPNRCDTSKYGWRNVDDDEYCDSNNYPTSESRCNDWENSTIVNHIETCTLKEDRCYNTDSQINEEYYCDSYNYVRPLGAKLNVGNYFVGNIYQDKIKDFDITGYMNKYLETCTDDYCMIPIEFDSYYETKFNISEVKVSYEVKYIENAKDVQNFVKSCDDCNYKINLTSNGDVNVKSIIYYGQNTAPIINNSKITIDLKEDSEIIINVLDNEDDVLLITSNHSGLYQLGNKLIWNPTYLDTGINYIEVIANDSIFVTKEIVEVEVITPKIAIESFTKIYDNNGHSIYEAVIGNYDTTQRTINWTFDSGDGNSIYSNQNVILEPKEESVILIEHYYSSYGNNSVMFRVNSLSDSFTSYTNQYDTKPIEVKNFNILNKDVNKVLFEFTIDANNSIYDIKNLTWSLDTGIDVINSDMSYNLTKGEGMDVIFEYIYPYSGNFNPKAIVNIGSLEFESEINLSFKSPLKISSVNTLFENMNQKVIEVNILNNASWNTYLEGVSLRVGDIAFENISMYPGEESTFISEMVFDNFGVQYLNIETNSGNFGDSMSYEVNVENPIGINANLLAPNVLEAEIISNWGIELQDINWTLGNISSNYQVSFNDSYFVIVETEDNITGELRVYNDQYENIISIFN